MVRSFVLGFIRIHILYHATEKPFYGSWMMKELENHGYELSPGTLYPILNDLEESGYLESCERVVEGKKRKYYRATEEGKRKLEELRPKVRELVNEVLEGESD
ncbi:PadR family transcriptional regulator [candidate division MSBL1 archaeon SCGC-AAA382A03]|uniref:PadR family transcriptional regulator n=1 Tax=candidate division MSBL1 archaeon SCGC-AAA382A03 TaxID=1698278 RepID=A0A133VF59_9EURY|nr:PadR family transcriptional regulator [candidate division MSBL1 archaeon SCGC-AAA382A03]